MFLILSTTDEDEPKWVQKHKFEHKIWQVSNVNFNELYLSCYWINFIVFYIDAHRILPILIFRKRRYLFLTKNSEELVAIGW